jgi:hypothetical protein
MPKGPGPVGKWILAHLREAVEKNGESRWVSIVDLTNARLGRDDPPSRDDLDGTRRAVQRLEVQGLLQVSQEPRLITRTVISPITGASKEVFEDREVTVVRLVPSIEQQVGEAQREVERCATVLLSRPGWEYAEKKLAQAKRAAERLAAQLEVAQG